MKWLYWSNEKVFKMENALHFWMVTESFWKRCYPRMSLVIFCDISYSSTKFLNELNGLGGPWICCFDSNWSIDVGWCYAIIPWSKLPLDLSIIFRTGNVVSMRMREVDGYSYVPSMWLSCSSQNECGPIWTLEVEA